MVKTCLASGCKQKFIKNGNISFFSIPKDKDRRAQWLKVLNQRNLEIKPFHVICSKHFKDCDFNIDPSGRKNLKPHAIPTSFEIAPQRTFFKKRKATTPSSQYNFRKRKPAINEPKKDHTYSTLKPMNPKFQQPFNDHTYTRLTESAVAPTHHLEHNYSLVSPHIDHAYLGPSTNPNHIISYPESAEPVVLDLRDHTYSKNNKKNRNVKKSAVVEVVKEVTTEEDVKPKTMIEGLTSGVFPPTYVIVDSQDFNSVDVKKTEILDCIGRKSKGQVEPVQEELCCKKYKSDGVLENCAVYRTTAQPRYVSDFTIADMSCEQNAKRYFQLSTIRLESQKYIIQKLRKQNSRLSNRFYTLGEEILRMKKTTKNRIKRRF